MSKYQRFMGASVATLTVVLVAACTVQVPGTPAAVAGPAGAGAPAPITFDEPSAPFAAEFVRMRTVDFCALHDVRAAEALTGGKGESLGLRGGLAGCDLEIDIAKPVGGWEFRLRVGRGSTTGWKEMALAGTTLLKDPNIDSYCKYLVPTAPNAGLNIEVGYSQAANSGPQPSDEQRCVTGERYLAEVVLPKWKNPPLLADGLTTPRVPLLTKDPCAALAAGVADIPEKKGRERTFSIDDPYICEGGRGTSISRYTVEFEVFSPILDLDGPKVQLGDITAFQAGGIGAGGCSFQVAVQPDLLFSKREKTVYHGGVSIGVGSCSETAVATKVLQNLFAQPDAPAGKPGAQVIGDITGA